MQKCIVTMTANEQIVPWNISGSNITVKQGACVGKMRMFVCIYISILPVATSARPQIRTSAF